MPQTQPRLKLGGYSKFSAQLIRQMEDYGWTGRTGANQHTRMQAPDGVTTCSVAPKEGSPRHRGNQTQVFKDWLRRMDEMCAEAEARAEQRELEEAVTKLRFARHFQPESTPVIETLAAVIPVPFPEHRPAPVDTAPEPEPVQPSEFTCGLCGREFAGRQPLSVHHVRAHVRVPCPVCGDEFSPGNLPRHQRKQHPPVDPEVMAQQLWQAQQDNARLREEAAGWERLAEETEERYAALLHRYNAVAEAARLLTHALES